MCFWKGGGLYIAGKERSCLKDVVILWQKGRFAKVTIEDVNIFIISLQMMIMTRLGNVIYDQPTTLEPYVLLEIASTTMAAILNPTLGFFPAFFYPSSFSQA